MASSVRQNLGWALIAAATAAGVVGLTTALLSSALYGILAVLLVGVIVLIGDAYLRQLAARPLRPGDRVRWLHGLADATGVLDAVQGDPSLPRPSASVIPDGGDGHPIQVPYELLERI